MFFMITVLIFFVLSDVCTGTNPASGAGDDLSLDAGDDSALGAGEKEKFRWTHELDAIAVKIFHKTKSIKGDHAMKMKEVWDRMLPQFNEIRAPNLRQHAVNLIYKDGESSRTHFVGWTPELKSDLIEMYHSIINSGGKGLSYRLHNEFYKKHSNIPRFTPHTLWSRARAEYESSLDDVTIKLRARIPWNSNFTEDVTRICREKSFDHKKHPKKLYEEWVQLHPEYKNKNSASLQFRMRKAVEKQLGEGNMGFTKYHKWTKREHAELLHMYRRMKPKENAYTLKLHERWGKMNPELKHLNAPLLLNRVTKLIRDDYKPSESDDERARVKYDTLFPKEEVRERKRRQLEVDKGKSKIDAAPEHPENMSPRSQESRPYQFYDFMSVGDSHGESSRNFGNYPHGESSNPLNHQQSETSSPSQSTPRSFINFF